MRDENGNTIKYAGSNLLGSAHFDDGFLTFDKTETFTITATVTEHVDYKGDKQTVVARPKEK